MAAIFRTIGINRRWERILKATEGLVYLNKSLFGDRILPKNRLLPLITASALTPRGQRVQSPKLMKGREVTAG